MSSNDASSSGDAELDALVRDLSRKVRTTEGQWVRDQIPLDAPSVGAGASTDAAASVEAQAEALIAALDDADADAGLDAGARVVDVADFDRFASAEMKQEADDIIALMMKYENVGASGWAAPPRARHPPTRSRPRSRTTRSRWLAWSARATATASSRS